MFQIAILLVLVALVLALCGAASSALAIVAGILFVLKAFAWIIGISLVLGLVALIAR